MILCDVDWKAIAAIISPIITSSVALFIFFNWRKQKGAEVIALESKETIKELLDISNTLNRLERISSHKQHKADIEREIEKFVVVSDTALKRLFFINYSINDYKIDKKINLFQNFATSILRFHNHRLNYLVDTSFSSNIVPSSNSPDFQKLTDQIDDLLIFLQPFSIYKTPPNFKPFLKSNKTQL